MAQIVVEIEIPHPIDEVWDDLRQLEQHVEWMADAERMDFLSESTRGVGVAMAVRTRVGPFVTTDVIEVREWDELRRIGVSHRGLVSGTGAFLLSPTKRGTRFVWDEDLTFPWYLGGGVTAQLARPVLRHIWRGNLRRFAARFDDAATPHP